jgi:hypothetical protein
MPSAKEVDEHTIKLAIEAFKDHQLILGQEKTDDRNHKSPRTCAADNV